MMQETKLTDEIYRRESKGFQVTATAAPSTHYSGVAVFYLEVDHLAI